MKRLKSKKDEPDCESEDCDYEEKRKSKWGDDENDSNSDEKDENVSSDDSSEQPSKESENSNNATDKENHSTNNNSNSGNKRETHKSLSTMLGHSSLSSSSSSSVLKKRRIGLGRVVPKSNLSAAKDDESESEETAESIAKGGDRNYYMKPNAAPVCLYASFVNLNKEAKNDKSGEGIEQRLLLGWVWLEILTFCLSSIHFLLFLVACLIYIYCIYLLPSTLLTPRPCSAPVRVGGVNRNGR
jgi:hypothetical protein